MRDSATIASLRGIIVSNSALQIHYTNFNSVYDNVVKPALASWGELASMLTSGHPVVVGKKLASPSFSAWRYKSIDDPTVDHGEKDGKPLKCFSKTHVRRLGSNLIEMSMLIIDFDGGLPLDEVQKRFGDYEYVCYTSSRHRRENKDKARVVLPFTEPMPKADFQRLKRAIETWIDGDGSNVADDATYSIGQVFLLPVVYQEYAEYARAWRNEGMLLDWHIFESIKTQPVAGVAAHTKASRERKTDFRLLPDEVLYTATGPVMVKDINGKISKVLCPNPSHGDVKPSEFVSVSNGVPFLVCRKCGTVFMERESRDDGIASGLVKIAAGKKTSKASGAK